MEKFHKIVKIEDYEDYIGSETVERIMRKAEPLTLKHIVHVNSTYYGGGVAELLSSFTLLLNSLDIRTGWRVIQGNPSFFDITKKMHNALQGGPINLTERKKQLYEEVVFEKHLPRIVFPPNRVVAASEMQETEFRRKFVAIVADQVGRYFYAHDRYADFALDAASLE